MHKPGVDVLAVYFRVVRRECTTNRATGRATLGICHAKLRQTDSTLPLFLLLRIGEAPSSFPFFSPLIMYIQKLCYPHVEYDGWELIVIG